MGGIWFDREIGQVLRGLMRAGMRQEDGPARVGYCQAIEDVAVALGVVTEACDYGGRGARPREEVGAWAFADGLIE